MHEIIGNTTATPTPRPDWLQENESKPDYIKNKPTILTEEDVVQIIAENGGTGGGVGQIQSDWGQTDETQVDYIKNKPQQGSIVEASIRDGSLVVTHGETIYAKGLSAYDLAKNNGFAGTEEEWLASLKGEKGDAGVSVVQTTGDSEVDVMSQKAVTDEINGIKYVYDFVPTVNVLNPANAESGYIDVTTLEEAASSNHLRTKTPISLVGKSKFYLRTTLENNEVNKEWIMCLIQLDAEGNKITYGTIKVNHIYDAGGSLERLIVDGASQLILWISGVNYGMSFDDWCISFEELDDFAEYDEVATVKKETLPPDVVYEEDLVELATEIADVRESAEALENIIDLVPTANLLNPANAESGYIDVTTLEEVASSNSIRTVTPISLEGNKGKIYFRTKLPNDEVYGGSNLCVIQLDAAGNRVSYTIYRVSTLYNNGGCVNTDAVAGASGIHVWINGVNNGASFADWCISFEELDSFVEYAEVAKIKESALPEDFATDLPFSGKTIVNFGDSIFGNKRPPDDISTKLAKLTGATVHNCGFGGCRMSTHSLPNYAPFSMFALADAIVSRDFSTQEAAVVATDGELVPSYFANTLALLESIDFSKVDIITIAYGTNDFTSSKNLDNEDNNKDTTTFAGAMRYSIERLLEAYPHLLIFSCGQTYRFWMDAEGVFVEDSDTKVYNESILPDFVAKTKEVAEEYHLPFIDNYKIGMNKFNRGVYFPATDGTHPNVTGNELIARHIAKELF